MFRNN